MPNNNSFTGVASVNWPLGKVVCVGRNYADHARELNNAIPDAPLLFIKPSSAVVPFGDLTLSERFETPHYETEMTVLIGRKLCCCSRESAYAAIAGLGIGLDLTLRELQTELKHKGHPWERAKAFDGSCVLSAFKAFDKGIDLQNLTIRLWRNDDLVQNDQTGQMLFPVVDLLVEISRTFTLEPGDVVMTGTPKGVGQLRDGDQLKAELGGLVCVESTLSFVRDYS